MRKCGSYGRIAALGLALALWLYAPAAFSQNAPAAPAAEIAAPEVIDPFLDMDINQALSLNLRLRKVEIQPSSMKTLFFTLWQHKLLQEAKRGFTDRRPEEHELTQEEDLTAPRPRGPREISLAGIVYKSSDRWTVWLNGARITPDAIPKEVIDIKVFKRYVELKWYDSFTNLIYPVRLKAHQRFNLDSRIFLPGTGTL